jgi:hypothetical protein
MSFVGEPYLIDIFISFCRGDAGSGGDSDLERWSRSFFQELRRELQDHHDLAGVTILFDDGSRPNEGGGQPFDRSEESFEEQASSAAVFVALISPSYLKSDRCLRELRSWREAQENRGAGTRGQILPILMWGHPPSGSENWSEALRGIGLSDIGVIEFFSDGRPQPYGWPGSDGATADRRFFHALLRVVGRIRRALLELRVVEASSMMPNADYPRTEDVEYLETERDPADEARRAEAMSAAQDEARRLGERERQERSREAHAAARPDRSPSGRSPAGVDLLEIRRRTSVRTVGSARPGVREVALESFAPMPAPPPPVFSPSRYEDEPEFAETQDQAVQPRWLEERRGLTRYAVAILLASAAVSFAALYLLTRKGLLGIFGSTGELVPFALGAAMAGGARRRGGSADVEMSAFAPERCCEGNTFLVQVLFHRPDAVDPQPVALRSDPATTLRAQKTLLIPLATGERVQLTISVPGCDLDDENDAVVWRGVTTSAAFPVRVPSGFAADAVAVTVRAFKEGEPIGRVSFTVPVQDTSSAAMRVAGDDARRYSQTFFSYASPDRPVVVRYTHAWSLLRMRFFQDFLSLDPGERWERRLYEEIDRSDLFLLFWSNAASQSEYVRKEAEYALMRQASGQQLEILPVVIEGPPCPAPPASLSAIHFNDRHSYVMRAVMDEAASRASH